MYCTCTCLVLLFYSTVVVNFFTASSSVGCMRYARTLIVMLVQINLHRFIINTTHPSPFFVTLMLIRFILHPLNYFILQNLPSLPHYLYLCACYPSSLYLPHSLNTCVTVILHHLTITPSGIIVTCVTFILHHSTITPSVMLKCLLHILCYYVLPTSIHILD